MVGLAVLTYHSVGGGWSGRYAGLSVPVDRLREQLTALVDDGWSLTGLTDALAGDPAPRGPVVALTFDDGFTDFADHAAPLLHDLGVGATLYVPSRHLGGTARWLHGPEGETPILDETALRALAAAGVEIGSHAADHVPLDVLPAAEQAVQVTESRDRLEQVLGAPVRSLAYPHGYHSASVRAAVRRAGYDNACALGHRLHRPTDDRLAVQRLLIGPHHGAADVRRLVRRGPGGAAPGLKRLATPGWRLVRRAARAAGRTWT